MISKTTFTSVTERINQAGALTATAAGDKEVHVMGASVVPQILKAGLAGELVLHVAPVLLGSGRRLFEHLGGRIQLERREVVQSRFATHLRYRAGAAGDGS